MAFYRGYHTEDLPRQRVLYRRMTGPYGWENQALMEQFKQWVREQGRWGDETVILGVALDDPAVREPSRCRYDVCLLISEEDPVETPEVQTRYLEGGLYLVFQIPHTGEGVAAAWQEGIPFSQRQGCRIDETRPVRDMPNGRWTGSSVSCAFRSQRTDLDIPPKT